MINYNLNTESQSIGGGLNELDLTKLSIVDLTSYSVGELDFDELIQPNTLYYYKKNAQSSIVNGPWAFDSNTGQSVAYNLQGGFSLLVLMSGISYINQILIPYLSDIHIFVRSQIYQQESIIWRDWHDIQIIDPRISNDYICNAGWFSPNTFTLTQAQVNSLVSLCNDNPNNLVLKQDAGSMGLLLSRPVASILTDTLLTLLYIRMENNLSRHMKAQIDLSTLQVTVTQEN